MTFEKLMATTPLDRWRNLTSSQRDAIGSTVLEWVFAELVSDDDGIDTTEDERTRAFEITDRALNSIVPLIEAAFPHILWNYPEGTHYEVRDRTGVAIGRIESERAGCRFVPTSTRRRPRFARYGCPGECLPAWVRHEIDRGGWWGAVLPDGSTHSHALARAA